MHFPCASGIITAHLRVKNRWLCRPIPLVPPPVTNAGICHQAFIMILSLTYVENRFRMRPCAPYMSGRALYNTDLSVSSTHMYEIFAP